MKAALKRLRALPILNVPLTHLVRNILRLLGVTPEFAIKHLPHAGITRVTLPEGQSIRLWSRGDDWVSNQLFWRGWRGYDGEVTPLFCSLAQRAEVVLDVGAHVGFYSVAAAAVNPKARIFAFEPLPAVFSRLQRNIRLNGLDNVVAVAVAVGAANGSAAFFHVPGIIPSSSSLSLEFMRGTADLSQVDVKVVRIDKFADERGIDRLDLVKIDTETTEPDVLSGMGDLLRSYRPEIICEVLTRADVERLTALLAPLGYRFHLLTDQGAEKREAIVPDPRWLNYFFTARS